MGDHLTAERDDPGKLVGILPITRQQLLIQSDHIDQISACRMAGNIDGGGVASVFSYIIEYPSNGSSGIVHDLHRLHMRRQAVFDTYNYHAVR